MASYRKPPRARKTPPRARVTQDLGRADEAIRRLLPPLDGQDGPARRLSPAATAKLVRELLERLS